MLEYEIIKPALACFDKFFDMDDIIIREVLKKIMPCTIIKAIKGLNKHSQEKIIENLSFKKTEEVRDLLQYWKTETISPYLLSEVKDARKKIVDRMNVIARKIEKGKYPLGPEILKG
jgi:flagellar motor switch protein FliG